jgi:hypothetical protein
MLQWLAVKNYALTGEIGRMAHEFTQMATSVEQQIADLQKQAHEIRDKIR